MGGFDRQFKLQSVSFAYPSRDSDSLRAIADLSLEIGYGEYVALIGGNGAGKSTLAKLLNGLLPPASGMVRSCGFDTTLPDTLWEVRRRVGMVFSDPANQLVGATVAEDVAFGPENLGWPPDEIAAQVQEALQVTGLTMLADRPVRQLSGGETFRAALAGVLAMRPEALIIDDGMALLDAATRSELLALLRSLHRDRKMTVIHLTHDMEEAVRADRIIILAAGRVVRDGTPQEVFADGPALQEFGLEAPELFVLCAGLREKGWNLPAELLDVEEVSEALLSLPGGRF